MTMYVRVISWYYGLSIKKKLAISNGILTVENKKQVMARADKNGKNKGESFTRACLKMIEMKKSLELNNDFYNE